MKYFFDATFSDHIPEILVRLGVDATHLKDHFAQGTDDQTWLKFLAERKWTLVSGDIAIAEKRARPEYAVLKAANIIAIFFNKGFTRADRWDQVWRTVKWWRGIQEFAETKCSAGDIIRVSANGKLERARM